MEESELLQEIADDLGTEVDKVEDFEEDGDNFSFSYEGNSYAGCTSEEAAEELAEEWLSQDVALWKDAVEGDQTTMGFDEWCKYVLQVDGWKHILCMYDGKSNDLPCGAVYWRD